MRNLQYGGRFLWALSIHITFHIGARAYLPPRSRSAPVMDPVIVALSWLCNMGCGTHLCAGAGLRRGAWRPPPPSPSKNVKKGVRRGHPEYLKCSKSVWRQGLRPGPRWGSLQRPPDSLAGGENPTPALGPTGLASRPFGPRFSPRQQILKTPLSLCRGLEQTLSLYGRPQLVHNLLLTSRIYTATLIAW